MAVATDRRPTSPSISDLIPPHNLDAEMALLGSMMISADACGEVVPVLGRDDAKWLYRGSHRQLFEVLIDLYDANRSMDLEVVRDELSRRDILEAIGGIEYVVTLAESVPSAANAEQYARIVRDYGLQRDLIRCADEIGRIGFDKSVPTSELLDLAEQKLFDVTERRISRQATRIREIVETVYAQVAQREGHFLSGLPTGFTELDDLTSGFQPGDFIIVAGRPSMGKTALGLTMAEHMAADENLPVVFFSLEMSNQQVAQRILCSRGKVDSHRFRKGMLATDDIKHLQHVCDELSGAPLLVDDTPGMSVLELRAKVRRLVRQHEIKAVFVDYIQLMRSAGAESRQAEISAISHGLKAIGRELNIPVVAMAQLNRQAEGREGHRPRMSDLRESGALEQDADVVLLIHREEYYKPQDEEARGRAELIIAKQRNGPTDVVRLQFNKHLTRFSNLSLVPSADTYVAASDVPF